MTKNMTRTTHKNILVTRPLSEEQVEYARRLGLNPLVAPALRVEFPRNWNKVLKKLDQYPEAAWVFTSRNGVEALGRILDKGGVQQHPGSREYGLQNIPDVYAVGKKTADALEELGVEALFPEQQDAAGLAKLIIGRYNKDRFNQSETLQSKSAGSESTGTEAEAEFPHPEQASRPVFPRAGLSLRSICIHWCGNRRRDELGRELKEAGFEYVDLEVYQTELNAIPLPDEMPDAILFFSPSAVEAFRKSDGFKRPLPELFAIGNTTGEALSLESGQNVHIPAEPSTEALLELIAEIFNE